MLINTNSVDSIIGVDHYSFNNNNGGLHKQIRLVDLLSIPSGGNAVGSGQGGLYTKLATSTGASNESSLFYTPGTSTNQYRLTRTITGEFAKFATNTNYQVGPPSLFGGWTFLPGGLLFQYGNTTAVQSSSGTTITFPITFTTVFNVNATIVTNSNSTIRFSILNNATNSGFTTSQTSSSNFTNLYWTAIGI